MKESPITKLLSKVFGSKARRSREPQPGGGEIEMTTFRKPYNKVRFISWEIHTGPKVLEPDKEVYEGISSRTGLDLRLDYLGQCLDIEARIQFTKEAILKAKQEVDKNDDTDTLKIFIAPEFLYRGAAGAYLHDMLDGWISQAPEEFGLTGTRFAKNWQGLFGGLKQLVNNTDYKDWLFVFGTAISAFFYTRKDFLTGKWVMNPVVSDILNVSLIQLGGIGNENACYASRKHYMSYIDLVKWYEGQTSVFNMQNTRAAEPESIIPDDILGITEGGSVFNIPGVGGPTGKLIDFGIEICLDHQQSGGNRSNNFGRIKTSNQYVKIQLVPSGGAELKEASIRLQPDSDTGRSYAINCDGLNNLTTGGGSQTQIWNGPRRALNALLETSLGGTNTIQGSRSISSVVETVPTTAIVNGINVAATELWVKGSGNVRVVEALPL